MNHWLSRNQNRATKTSPNQTDQRLVIVAHKGATSTSKFTILTRTRFQERQTATVLLGDPSLRAREASTIQDDGNSGSESSSRFGVYDTNAKALPITTDY